MTDPAIVGGDPAFPEGLPFFRPARPAMDDVIARLGPSYEQGMLTNSHLVRELEERAAAYLEVPEVVAVASCTAGLMLVTQALAKLGTHVVMPSFTFSATAHAAAWAGAIPRFAECEPGTCQVDVEDAAARLDGASLLIGTHIFGSPCRPEALEAVADREGIPVIFDAAHAFGAYRRGRKIGGFGVAEVFSLSPTKVLVGGEGGLIALHNRELAAHLRIGRDYGNPGNYDTQFIGLNARMSELHAAVALCSLEQLDDHLARRRDLADRYREALVDVPGVDVQQVDPEDVSTYKDLTVLVDAEVFGVDRDGLIKALDAEGVGTRPYFHPPVHRQQAYSHLANGPLPVTDEVSSQVVSLPLWRDMPTEAIPTLGEAILRIHKTGDQISAMLTDQTEEGLCVPS